MYEAIRREPTLQPIEVPSFQSADFIEAKNILFDLGHEIHTGQYKLKKDDYRSEEEERDLLKYWEQPTFFNQQIYAATVGRNEPEEPTLPVKKKNERDQYLRQPVVGVKDR